MVIGTAIGTVGSGLFLMLDLDTKTVLWAVFLVICGLGTGFAINLPYTVAQAVLTLDSPSHYPNTHEQLLTLQVPREEHVPTGNGTPLYSRGPYILFMSRKLTRMQRHSNSRFNLEGRSGEAPRQSQSPGLLELLNISTNETQTAHLASQSARRSFWVT